MDAVTSAYEAIRQFYGEVFSVEQVMEFTSFCRRKPLLRPIVLPSGALDLDASGCVLPFQDVDVICLQPGLSTISTVITTLHECSHLLCGHVLLNSPNLPIMRPNELNGHLQSALCRDHFDIDAFDNKDMEIEADSLAALLYQHVSRYGKSLSPAIWGLF